MRLTALRTATLVALLTAPLLAQQARRPDYQTLRFEERWDARPASHDVLDPIKHVAVAPGVFVTFAGQERVRAERVSHLGLGGLGTTDGFALTRLRLSADVHAGPWLRAFAEARDSRAANRDLPGGARPQDADHWDAQNAFVELGSGQAFEHGAAAVRVGRQELLYDKERLVSPGDWSNAPRTFQGVRATASLYAASVDVFTMHPVTLDPNAVNGPDVTTRFSGAHATLVSGRTTAQLYYYDLRQRTAKFAGASGQQLRGTAGAHLSGKTPARWLAYDAEGAWQGGAVGARRIRAWMFATDLTASSSAHAKPSLGVGLDASSGDRDAGDSVVGTFNQLYPSGHSFVGYADVLGRQNVVEARAVATATPVAKVQLRLAGHLFGRTSLGDGLYTTAGAALRAAGGSPERFAGGEGDLSATVPLGAHLKLAGGYAHFAPGSFLRESKGGARAVDWAFATTTFTF